MLEIRRYDHTDAAVVWRLHQEGLLQTDSHAGDGPWDDDLRTIDETYLRGQGEFLVGVLEGEVVAMGALRRVSDSVGEIKRMRVASHAQGLGIGGTILDRILQRASELGYRTLRLDTTSRQIPAQQLYRSRGFNEVGRSRNQTDLEIVFFELELVGRA